MKIRAMALDVGLDSVYNGGDLMVKNTIIEIFNE